MAEEELKALSDEERESLRQRSNALHAEMNEAIAKIRRMEKEFQEAERKLDQDIALAAVGPNIEDLVEKYQDYPQVTEYLKEMEGDILKNIDDFKKKSGCPSPLPFPMPEPSFTQYQVNLFVDNAECKGRRSSSRPTPTTPICWAGWNAGPSSAPWSPTSPSSAPAPCTGPTAAS